MGMNMELKLGNPRTGPMKDVDMSSCILPDRTNPNY